jgi:hypothetical protein
VTATEAKKIVEVVDSLTTELKALHKNAICEVCGGVFMYLVTKQTAKRKPRAHPGHCSLVLEQREGRVARENWQVIKEKRKQ